MLLVGYRNCCCRLSLGMGVSALMRVMLLVLMMMLLLP